MIGNNTSGTDAPSEVSTNVSGMGRSNWASAVEQTVKKTVEMDQRNKVKGIAPSLSKDGLEVTRVQKRRRLLRILLISVKVMIRLRVSGCRHKNRSGGLKADNDSTSTTKPSQTYPPMGAFLYSVLGAKF